MGLVRHLHLNFGGLLCLSVEQRISLANLSDEFLDIFDKYSIRRDSFNVKLLKKDIEALSQDAVKKDDLAYGFMYTFAATGDKKAKFSNLLS